MLLALSALQLANASPGGTNLVNTATATFNDASGHQYSTSSNTVAVTIAKLAALVVTPKEAQPNPATESIGVGSDTIRTYTIANTSNISDAYTISSLSAGSLQVKSIAFLTPTGPVPVVIGTTVSPTIAPGGSISVQVVLGTGKLSVGDQVSITLAAQTTVTGTANGLQTDSGEQWVIGATASNITGPGGPNTQIDKRVDGVRSMTGQAGVVITYDILAKNSGGSPANNVVITDPMPAGITAVLSSVTINGVAAGGAATLNDSTLTVTLPTLAPGASLDVKFDADVPADALLGTSYVNIGSIASGGGTPIPTLPASVLLGSSNIVYDGYLGQSNPVAGAVVSLLDSAGNLVPLTGNIAPSNAFRASSGPQSGSAANPTDYTKNPFITGPDGSYGFALLPSQLAPAGSTYLLTVAASGYLNRRLKLLITPAAGGNLYSVTTTALDGQPIAQAGAFTLTSTNVTLANVFGLFGNVPLFRSVTIAVTKTASVQAVAPGDRLDFTLTFQNQMALPALQATVVDTLPAGLVYAPGTARVEGVATDPAISGNTLTWTLPQLLPGQTYTIKYSTVVLPSDTPGSQLVNGVSVGGTAGNTRVSGNANVTVAVIGGAFGYRRVLTGRVFTDLQHTGHFKRGDKGIEGVRVFLEDGSYVTTDPDGKFDFPSVRPGPHVVRIDPSTLPKDVRAVSHARLNSTRSLQQLVHGIFDESTMEDIEFALEPTQ